MLMTRNQLHRVCFARSLVQHQKTIPSQRRHLSSTCNNAKGNAAIAATRKWFNNIVVKGKLCPFATSKVLRIVPCYCGDNEDKTVIDCVRSEVAMLVGPESNRHDHETTLIVLVNPTLTTTNLTDGMVSSTALNSETVSTFGSSNMEFFADFRSFVRLSWELQEQAIADFVEDVQVVLFHPTATHQTYGNSEVENAGDYTIRAPYPTIHLLRQADVLEVVSGSYPNLENLPARNQAKLIQQGVDACRQRLRECYHDTA